MTFDLLISGANLYYGNGRLDIEQDIGIKDGKIVKVGKKLDEQAAQVIEAKNMLVSPGFMDSHMHIDLSYTFDYTMDVPSLIGGAKLFAPLFDHCWQWPYKKVFDDITDRSARTIEACTVNGTSGLKTNVTYLESWKTTALDSMVYLKKRYKNYCDVYNCVSFSNQMPDDYFWDEAVPIYEKAAENGDVDFISGYPHKHPNGKEVIDSIFELAARYHLPIDIHCDESDVPDLTCFAYVLEKTIETGMQGKVSLGHVTALSSKHMDESEAQRLIKRAAQADVNITSLTSCNMYLMNTNRRGPTRVRELLDAGVNVAVASDDIREVLRPYGNCDLLEEALLTAEVHKMGTTDLLRNAFDLVTYNGARNMLIEGYGLDPGCRADLVILDAPSPELAVLDQCKKPYVLKNGVVVARNGKMVEGYYAD